MIADEPVSMLDVSLRAGILRLMLDLRDERGVSFLFVTHDLSLAWVIAERIAVVVPRPDRRDRRRPRRSSAPREHPYTRALVSVIPVPETGEPSRARPSTGEAPSASQIPAGCRFRPRCPLYRSSGEPERCRNEDPVLHRVSTGNGAASHQVACHFVEEVVMAVEQTMSSSSSATWSGSSR